MELPDASSIDSYPSNPRSPGSITSIDELEISLPTRKPRLARHGNESSPRPGAYVTSIEYIQDEAPVREEASPVRKPVISNQEEFGFIRKVNFDREKFFRLHCSIEQPEQQLLQETLRHFQKRSANVSEHLDTSAQPKPSKFSDAVSAVLEQQRGHEAKVVSARGPKKPIEENQGREARPSTSRLHKKQSGMLESIQPFQDRTNKENEGARLNIKTKEEKRPEPTSFKLIIQDQLKKSLPKLAELGPVPQKSFSMFSQRQSTNKKSVASSAVKSKGTNHTCQCRKILRKIEETSQRIESDLINKVFDKLACVTRDLSSIESQYASHKAESQFLKSKLQTIDEYPELNQKTGLRLVGLNQQEHQSLAFKSQNASLFIHAPSSALPNALKWRKPSGSLTTRPNTANSLLTSHRRNNPFKV
jgi:hypothetical protein